MLFSWIIWTRASPPSSSSSSFSSSRRHNFSTTSAGGPFDSSKVSAGGPCGFSIGSAGRPREVSAIVSLMERLCQNGENEQAQCLPSTPDGPPHLDHCQDIHQSLFPKPSALTGSMPADSLPHLDNCQDIHQNLCQDLHQNLRQNLCRQPAAPTLTKKMQKKMKKKKREEPDDGDQTELLLEQRLLNWGSLKRPRGSRTQEQIPPRPPPPLSQRRLSCVVTRRGHVETEKQVVNPPVTFQPSTPSPQDSTSRLLTSNGQDLGTVLNKQTPWYYSRQSGRIQSKGRIMADQSRSSPCKRQPLEETDEGCTPPSRPIIEREGSRDPSRLTIERGGSRPHSRSTIEREGPRPPPPTIERVPFEWPKIVISLSCKEKEEDFLIMKGSKLPQRPKRRLKAVQRTLTYCIPGNWLSDITRNRYEVREKKSIQKKPTGLKAMESLESDSDC